MRYRAVPISEIFSGKLLRNPKGLGGFISLLASDHVGNPEGIRKEIAAVDLQIRKLETRRKNLLEELALHEDKALFPAVCRIPKRPRARCWVATGPCKLAVPVDLG